MPKFVVLNADDVVTNFIVADSLQDAEENTKSTCLEAIGDLSDLTIGVSVWNGEEFVNSY